MKGAAGMDTADPEVIGASTRKTVSALYPELQERISWALHRMQDPE